MDASPIAASAFSNPEHSRLNSHLDLEVRQTGSIWSIHALRIEGTVRLRMGIAMTIASRPRFRE